MYTPAHFAVDDAAAGRYLADIATGDLITMTEFGLVATFLPMIHDPDDGALGSLIGHVARSNDQCRQPPRAEALVIGRGPDAYISPTWYASKAEHGRVVPTWNYVTTHVYGELVVHDDVAWLDSLVRRLTVRHESGRERPWSVEDAPHAFYEGQLRAIVGLELRVSRVEVKVKMSQNRPDPDIDGVVAGLAGDGREDVASLVESSRPRRDK
jgi:transcriptional regulator